MSKFQIAAVQMFSTEDGKQFATVEEAQAHQVMLENVAEFSAIVDNHCNDLKLADRARSMRFNAAVEFLGWLKTWEAAGSPTIERTVFDSEPTPRKKKGEEPVAGEVVEPTAEAADDVFGAE